MTRQQSGTSTRTPIGGMCSNHKQFFFNVARAHKVWILVRATNKSSLQYFGPDYPNIIPKPKSCEAKTADCGDNAGLVVCPSVSSGSFSPERINEAETAWTKWAPEWLPVQLEKAFLDRSQNGDRRPVFDDDGSNKHGLPLHYGVIEDEHSPHYGCVVNLESGTPKMMHGDYDLYDVVDPESPHDRRRMEKPYNNSRSVYGPKTVAVQKSLNDLMSDGSVATGPIQHGEHLAYFGHKQDMIYVFSPNSGDALIIIYPFVFGDKDGVRSVKALFAKLFEGRQPRGKN